MAMAVAKGRIIRLEAPAYSGVLRTLSGLHVDLEAGKTSSWVTVTRTGTFSDPRYGKFEISRQKLLAMVANFEAGTFGQEIFIDVAHRPGDGAAGKVVRLAVEGDRLRALVEWTDFGLAAIRERGFRYLSAEYHEDFEDNETGQKHGPVLMGAGLVTRPCIKRLDPIQLAEASGDVPTFLHPTLLSELTQEIQMKFAELLKQLKEKLQSFKLAEVAVESLMAAATAAVGAIAEEAQAKVLLAAFEDSGKKLADQIGTAPATVQLSIASPSGLTADDVKQLMHDEAKRLHDARVADEQGRAANVKILTDAIAERKDFDAAMAKELGEAVADLVTSAMTAEQVKKLAAAQVAQGERLLAARRLASMGYTPQGSVILSVDSSNEVKKLQEVADRRLGLADMPDSIRFAATNGSLSPINKAFAEKALAEYDRQHGAQLHAEHRLLAAGDGVMADVAVPATFERTVMRESLYGLVGLQFVDVGTAAFSATHDLPYSYRDTTAAGMNNTRVYEGGAIPRAGVKQAMETAYILPQKLAFEVSDELRYLTSNGQLVNWDVVAENARNAIRIVGEDTERLIFNEILNASDQYASVAVSNEAVATADGTKTIFKLANFPVLRPKKIYNLQGAQVGSTSYAIAGSTGGTARAEWDGTGTQAAGLYWWMDYNLGEVHFVDKDGNPSAPANTNAIVFSYTYTTNIAKFDTDNGSVDVAKYWNTFLYRYGLRKAVIKSERYHACNFGLMSSAVMTAVEQAEAFVESGARNGTNLDSQGNLGVIKAVPNYESTAPGLAMGDQRVILGERNVTRYRMAKGWTMGQLQDQKDSNGRFIGKKEAYGDQFIFLHTPTQLKAALTSIVLYSGTARVNR